MITAYLLALLTSMTVYTAAWLWVEGVDVVEQYVTEIP